MLENFIKYVCSIFPNFDEDLEKNAIEEIEQFTKGRDNIEYIKASLLPQLSQGDIISNIPFCYYDADGHRYDFKAPGMVLSTSCTIDNKPRLLISPVVNLDDIDVDSNRIKSNLVYSYFYIGEKDLFDKCVAFDIVNSYHREVIFNALDANKIERLYSLNQVGFYLFIMKMSIFLMRTEDSDTQKKRA